MEPLNLKLQRGVEYFLLSIYFGAVLIPLAFVFFRDILAFDLSYLSPLFFWLLIKATLFALLQATLSVGLVAAFSYIVVAFVYQDTLSSRAQKIFETTGFLAFSLSPTLVALSMIFSFSAVTSRSPSGIWAIVFCHFLMNAAYFASQFYNKAKRFYAKDGASLSLYLKSLGAPASIQQRLLLWPLFIEDFKSWFPQLFLWCFMSFAPIVLLAADTSQNTPELLLYYSLLNDPSGSRMLIIFALSASLSFILTRFAQRLPKSRHSESHFAPGMQKVSSLKSTSLKLTSVLLLSPFLYTLLSPLFKAGELSLEFVPSLVPTLIIFVTTFIFSLIFGIASALCSRELKAISFCNFISAPMVLMGLLSFESQNPLQSYVLISFGAFLALFPWAHRRIRSFVESLPPEHKDLALSLGMKNYSYIKNYLWPEVGPSIWRLSLLFSLWSLGEYTFSKAFLSRSSTLALFIEEKLRRYQFAEASLALSLSLSISVIVVTLLLWKGRKNAAL